MNSEDFDILLEILPENRQLEVNLIRCLEHHDKIAI